ncbi:tripartite motif-containing protein 16 [Alosa pseudoharengus]|uniref:tripartite motif-containing protein 16 n=1 Tax=Alosa pseudoharengus TaxID=34774 RepID=UPI003F892D2E
MADTQLTSDQTKCILCEGTQKAEEGKDCPQCSKKSGSGGKTGPVVPQVNGQAGKENGSDTKSKSEGAETQDPNKTASESKSAAAATEEAKIQEDLKQSEDPKKPLEDSSGQQTQVDAEEVKREVKENGEGAAAAEEKKVEEVEKVEEEVLGPDDVVCDSCIDSPRRATRSCLTCLVSYCEDHLRPHLENAKFQNHRLVEPLRDIERRTCESHKWPLELYCITDACCVCQDCAAEDHHGHNTMRIEEARKKIEKELNDKQKEMVKTVSAAENAINKLQVNTVSIETSVKDVRSVIEEQFSALQAAVERAQREVTEMVEGEERQALRQVEGIRVHLEQRCTDLKKTQTQVEKISRNKNDVDFLQEYSQWKKDAPDISLPGVSIGLMDRLNAFSRVIVSSTQELCDKLLSTYLETLKETCKNDKLSIKTTVQTIVAAKQNVSIPDPKTREDFMKYSSPLNLDGNTVHKFLRLTEENHKVTNTTPWQHSYPDVPERFEHWRQVLTTESFYMDRHYFEVDISGEGTHVGLTYKSIERKGKESNCCITSNNFSWCLQWNGRSFSAWHSDVETPLSVPKATRIGVYVDYHRGHLAFYSVDDGMSLIHEYQAEFLEPLYPAFWLSKKENVVLLIPPGGALPVKSPSPPSSPPTLHAAPPLAPSSVQK